MIIQKEKSKLKQTTASHEWSSRASLNNNISISAVALPLAYGGSRPIKKNYKEKQQKKSQNSTAINKNKILSEIQNQTVQP